MPMEIVRNDITRMNVDAIVNAANKALALDGGVTGAIHKAAGPELLCECQTLGGCETGEAKLTKGYNLPCKYVIHTVGPVWRGGRNGEEQLLRSCYKNALALAKQHGVKSIAFPLLSAGIFGYPREDALRVATDTIRDFLLADDTDMLVYMVVYDERSFHIGKKLYAGISEYIDDNYVTNRPGRFHSFVERWRDARQGRGNAHAPDPGATSLDDFPDCAALEPFETCEVERAAPASSSPFTDEADTLELPTQSLMQALEVLDESFSQMVLRLIDEKGITDPMCYKKANIDRKLFSKIRKDAHYKPKKTTALAIAVALELPLAQVRELLEKAGFALSHSAKLDVIVEYFIVNKRYDIFAINEALYQFDQPLLGGSA